MKSPDRDAADERVKLWLSIAAAEHPLSSYDIFILRKHLHDAASELATLRRRVAEMEGSMAVPAVWSEAERDGMSQAYAKASTRQATTKASSPPPHGCYATAPLPPGRNEG